MLLVALVVQAVVEEVALVPLVQVVMEILHQLLQAKETMVETPHKPLLMVAAVGVDQE
jgi:hypothetical protein